MFKQAIKFALTAFLTGLFTAFAATLYSLVVTQVTTDESASQRARMVQLLSEISSKLDRGNSSLSFNIGTRSVDNVKPLDIEQLSLNYKSLKYYKKQFYVGAKLYKTSISLSGIADAGLQEQDIKEIDWTFDGKSVGTTQGIEELFLSGIKKPFFSSEKSFDVIAQVWLNEDIVKEEGVSNPVRLQTSIE